MKLSDMLFLLNRAKEAYGDRVVQGFEIGNLSEDESAILALDLHLEERNITGIIKSPGVKVRVGVFYPIGQENISQNKPYEDESIHKEPSLPDSSGCIKEF